MTSLQTIPFENFDVEYYSRKYARQIITENVIDLSAFPRDYRVFAPRNVYKNYLLKGIPAKRSVKLLNRRDYLTYFKIGIDDVDWKDYSDRLGLNMQDFEALQHYYFYPGQTFIRFKVSGTLYYDIASQDFQLTVPFTNVLQKMKVAGIVNENATFVGKLLSVNNITTNPSSDLTVNLTL